MIGKREKQEDTPLQNHRGCSKSFDDGHVPICRWPSSHVLSLQNAALVSIETPM